MLTLGVLCLCCYFHAFGTADSLSITFSETLELTDRIAMLEDIIINQQFNIWDGEYHRDVKGKSIPHFTNLIYKMESRIRALENKVNEQELSIAELKQCERNDDFLRTTVADLQHTIKQYGQRFQDLETSVRNQNNFVANFEDHGYEKYMDTHTNNSDIVNQELNTSRRKSTKNRIIRLTNEPLNTGKNEYHTQKNNLKRLREATPHNVITSNTIAFYAIMSSNSPSISVQYPLRFDVVKTNQGNAYHPTTGVFMVPESGIYVFTWTIRIAADDYHSTELMVNTESEGIVHLNSQKTTSEVTGIVVVHVNNGDDVFVRTYGMYNHGLVTSDHPGRSSFAGWKLT